MSLDQRRRMIEPDHTRLSIARQCELVSISRSGLYRRPAGETPLNLELMRLIDAQFLETPWYGARQMARHLRREGYMVGRKRVRRLMAKMGLAPIYQRPRTSTPHPEHRSSPTCCGTWRSSGRTRSGARTSPTCRCGAASSTWSR
jgi:putative transposase